MDSIWRRRRGNRLFILSSTSWLFHNEKINESLQFGLYYFTPVTKSVLSLYRNAWVDAETAYFSIIYTNISLLCIHLRISQRITFPKFLCRNCSYQQKETGLKVFMACKLSLSVEKLIKYWLNRSLTNQLNKFSMIYSHSVLFMMPYGTLKNGRILFWKSVGTSCGFHSIYRAENIILF